MEINPTDNGIISHIPSIKNSIESIYIVNNDINILPIVHILPAFHVVFSDVSVFSLNNKEIFLNHKITM